MPLLEESRLRAGEDFSVAFSPERVDPGRTDFTRRTTPKVVGGLTDTRESPALKVITLLPALGARVAYHDPFVAQLPLFALEHETVDAVLEDADIAVVVTAHADVDHADVIARAPRTINLRGITRGTSQPAVQRL